MFKAIGTLLASLFGGLFASLTKYFVAEKAFRIAAIAVMLALLAAIVLSLKSCSQGICSSAINSVASQYPTFAMGLGVAFNTTTYTAASSFILVWTACQLYIVKKRMFGVLESGK